MKTVRMSLALASVVAALSWSTASRADDTMKTGKTSSSADESVDKDKDKHGTHGTTDTSGTTTDTPSTTDTTTTTTSGTVDTTGPMDTGASGATGTTGTMGTTPYGQTQAAPYGQPSTTTYDPNMVTTTTSRTTTTAATYDPMVSAERRERSYRPNRPMLVTGSAILIGTYAGTAIQGAVSDTSADRNNLIPIAGPWINMGERQCQLGDCDTREDLHNVLLIGSGVGQAVGLGLTIASLFVSEDRDEYAKARRTPQVAKVKVPELHVLPVSMGRGGAGLGAVGTF